MPVYKRFSIKVGAQKPYLRAVLRGPKGLVPLTGCIVKVRYRIVGTLSWTEKTAVIVDSKKSKVEYRWAVGDTNTAGEYEYYWHILYPDNEFLAVPTHGYMPMDIET